MSIRYYTIEPHPAAKPVASVIVFRLGLDLDVEAFNEINAELIDRWPIASGHHVIVDLAQSRYMGSVLLGLLINVRQRTRAGGGGVAVIGASPRLLEVFRSANLDRLLTVATTREQGLALLS